MFKSIYLVKLILCTITITLVLISINAIPSNTTVTISQGTLLGKITLNPDDKPIVSFKGIPFAAPPVGPLRWSKPDTDNLPLFPKPFYQATKYGNACVQNADRRVNITRDSMSEDCLYLNVWAPFQDTAQLKNDEKKKFPVMLFIHGGSFVSGSGSMYDGSNMVHHDRFSPGTVIVSINYRLGAFGYLAEILLSGESSEGTSSGNYAFLDQLAALKWVYKNIEAFGGDKDKITLFGESAGGISISNLLTSRLVLNDSENMVNKAIIQSGVFASVDTPDLKSAQENGKKVFEAIGCSSGSADKVLECVRSVPSEKVFEVTRAMDWKPIMDGYVIERPFMESFRKGAFKKVDLIIGTTENEMSAWFCKIYRNQMSEELFMKKLIEFYGKSNVEKILSFYNETLEEGMDTLQKYITIQSDAVLHCPANEIASIVSKQVTNTYLYTFTYKAPFVPNSKCEGAPHASELPFLFPSLLGNYEYSQDELNLMNDFNRYWTTFSISGDPNLAFTQMKHSRSLKQCFYWQQYGNNNGQYDLKLDIPSSARVRSKYWEETCNLWKNIPVPHKFP